MKLFAACIACGDGPLDSDNGDNVGGRIHGKCGRLLRQIIIERHKIDEAREIRYLWQDETGKTVERVLTLKELRFIKNIKEK